ncbi:MAG TPA: Hsp20/alpha crystallin family protein [Ktedonobacteraceae bacterium]|nr:Hsp20/alpha crystallin family protein [Ktedonobacteraceae bacterium]
MHEKEKILTIPVKMYRSENRLMVTAPLPGLQPEDIVINISNDGRLLIQGDARGLLKDIKELLLDEWSFGTYYRELELPNPVDGAHANVSYGNGVVVVTLPISQRTVPASLVMEKVGVDRGQRVGNSGQLSL